MAHLGLPPPCRSARPRGGRTLIIALQRGEYYSFTWFNGIFSGSIFLNLVNIYLLWSLIPLLNQYLLVLAKSYLLCFAPYAKVFDSSPSLVLLPPHDYSPLPLSSLIQARAAPRATARGCEDVWCNSNSKKCTQKRPCEGPLHRSSTWDKNSSWIQSDRKFSRSLWFPDQQFSAEFSVQVFAEFSADYVFGKPTS